MPVQLNLVPNLTVDIQRLKRELEAGDLQELRKLADEIPWVIMEEDSNGFSVSVDASKIYLSMAK